MAQEEWMPVAQLEGRKIHYREMGSSEEAVVLLHALPMHSGMWQPQLEALAPRFRVIAPDWRGFGESGPVPDASTMGLLAGDVVALLGHLRLHRVVFAGLSMGGYVLFELYRRAPELFRGAVLCDTRANADTAEGAAAREQFAKAALDKGLDWVAGEMLPKLLCPSPDPEVAKRAREIVLGGTPAGVAALHRGLARRPDSTPLLSKMLCPTLVLVGEQDALSPPEVAEQMASAIPGARLTRIPGAGHLSNLENPSAFNRALLDHLGALPA